MKTICAWCGEVLRDGDGPVSHGICGPCADRVKTGPPALPDYWREVDREMDRSGQPATHYMEVREQWADGRSVAEAVDLIIMGRDILALTPDWDTRHKEAI